MFLIDKILATGFFSGYIPKAPGTAGSIFALVIIYFVNPNIQNYLVLIALTLAIGVKTSSRLETVWGKDPSKIVIDEFAGMWIALLGHDLSQMWVLAAGFILFRVFDIFKPFGINALQKSPEGWGVMLDDVLAGIYTNIILWIISFSM